MKEQIIYGTVFLILLIIFLYFDFKNDLLKDSSTAIKKPYSYSRVQLAWWTLIILSSFISIVIVKNKIPELDPSTLILIGISSATIATGRLIDVSDQKDLTINRYQNNGRKGLLLDIISDQSGASIHRLQTVLFNLTFGIWMIITVLNNLNDCSIDVSKIIPIIQNNNLILLGLSSATYAALKIPENSSTKNSILQPENVKDESKEDNTIKG